MTMCPHCQNHLPDLPQEAPGQFLPQDAWNELVHKDDRTSPEEYPEMCLISFDELKDYMERHVGTAQRAALDDLATIEDNCWDLRCRDVPTGGDDYDIVWDIIEHHQAAPKERVVGTGRSVREALCDATSSLSRPERSTQGQ